jgi:hypothetical protein
MTQASRRWLTRAAIAPFLALACATPGEARAGDGGVSDPGAEMERLRSLAARHDRNAVVDLALGLPASGFLVYVGYWAIDDYLNYGGGEGMNYLGAFSLVFGAGGLIAFPLLAGGHVRSATAYRAEAEAVLVQRSVPPKPWSTLTVAPRLDEPGLLVAVTF